MDKEWIGLIGALAGTAVGGVVTFFVERARSKRERFNAWLDLKRLKYEELGQAVEDVRLSYAEVAIAARGWAVGNKASIERLNSVTVPMARLATLLRLYAPEFEEQLQVILGRVLALNEEVARFGVVRRVDDVGINLAATQPIFRAQQEVDRGCTALLNDLTRTAKELIPERA